MEYDLLIYDNPYRVLSPRRADRSAGHVITTWCCSLST